MTQCLLGQQPAVDQVGAAGDFGFARPHLVGQQRPGTHRKKKPVPQFGADMALVQVSSSWSPTRSILSSSWPRAAPGRRDRQQHRLIYVKYGINKFKIWNICVWMLM